MVLRKDKSSPTTPSEKPHKRSIRRTTSLMPIEKTLRNSKWFISPLRRLRKT